MLKKTVEYVDYNGNKKKEDFWFNISETEATKLQYSINGGLVEKLKKIVKVNDTVELMKFFDEFICMAYGEKTEFGGFAKTPEILERFKQSEAYNKIFMELVTDAKAASEFVNAVIPNVPEEAMAKARAEFIEETGADYLETPVEDKVVPMNKENTEG